MHKQVFENLGYQVVNGYSKPLSFVYEDNIVVEPETSKSSQLTATTHFLERIEYVKNEGIKIYMFEVEYPFIGCMPDPMDWFFLNQAKRLLVEGLKLFKTWQFIFSFIFTWNKIKYVEKMLKSYNNITFKGLSYLFIKEEYQTPITSEIFYIVSNFLINIGINQSVSYDFAKIISHFIQYDDAYRLRLMDIFTEANEKEMLKNPVKEINRLISIFKDRENKEIFKKFDLIKFLTNIIRLPKYKKAFKETMEMVDFDKLRYTEADRYWSSIRGAEYKFFGLNEDERQKLYENE